MRTFVYLFISALSLVANSQNSNLKWYFGDKAAIDFNSSTPTALLNSNMMTFDNCASMSERISGDLLFYSNGINVWNRNHQIMFNGTGLNGNITAGYSAFPIKKPGANNLYYLFTCDAEAGTKGIQYSIIDLDLDNGLGGITEVKNVQILQRASEKITATKHANGKDIWIITHEWNSNNFTSYLLSENELAVNPIISSVGAVHSGGTNGVYNALGQISINLSGSKVVCAIYDLNKYEIFDFDNSTGILTNPMSITNIPRAWGAEFSPNSRYLYTTTWLGNQSDIVRQFDLSTNDQSAINQSVKTVGNLTSPNQTYKSGYLQLGPDNKIYIAKFDATFIASINSPDNDFLSCDFTDNSISLGGRLSKAGLPAFLKENQIPKSIADNLLESDIKIFPNPASNFVYLSVTKPIKSVKLYNLDGKLIYRLDSPSYINLEINVFDLNSGIYIVEVESKNNSIRSKIIVFN